MDNNNVVSSTTSDPVKNNMALCEKIKRAIFEGKIEKAKRLLNSYNWNQVTLKFLESWIALNQILHRVLIIQFEKSLEFMLEKYYKSLGENGMQLGSLQNVQAYLTKNGRPNECQIYDIAKRIGKPFAEVREILDDKDVQLHEDLIAIYRNPLSYLFKPQNQA